MENDEITKKNNELLAELQKCTAGSPQYQRLVAAIVENNVSLVHYIANRGFLDRRYTSDCDDLIAEGLFGLFHAVKSFDSAKEIPFGNYAAITIKGFMLNYLRKQRRHKARSLEDSVIPNQEGDKLKIGNTIASPVDFVTDIVENDEKERQLTWVRTNLDRLTPLQQRVLINQYLLGEKTLGRNALAKKFNYWPTSVSAAKDGAIAKLRKMYYRDYPAENEIKEQAEQETAIELTPTEKIATKEKLKTLILTKLAPQQQMAMLCKFYSPSKKTNQQVAQEMKMTKGAVELNIIKASKRLCTLYNRSQDQQQLTSKAVRNILKSGIETNVSERER